MAFNTGYVCYSHVLYEYIYKHSLSQASVIEVELKKYSRLQFKQSKNKVDVTVTCLHNSPELLFFVIKKRF